MTHNKSPFTLWFIGIMWHIFVLRLLFRIRSIYMSRYIYQFTCLLTLPLGQVRPTNWSKFVICYLTNDKLGHHLSGRCMVGIWLLAISRDKSAEDPWPARLVSPRDGFGFVTGRSVHWLAARLWSLCHRRSTLATILLLRCFADLCTLCHLWRFPYCSFVHYLIRCPVYLNL